MGDHAFCPRCGTARVGRLCHECGYDYLEGARTPAVTLSRGINPMSLLIGVATIAVLAFVIIGPMLVQ